MEDSKRKTADLETMSAKLERQIQINQFKTQTEERVTQYDLKELSDICLEEVHSPRAGGIAKWFFDIIEAIDSGIDIAVDNILDSGDPLTSVELAGAKRHWSKEIFDHVPSFIWRICKNIHTACCFTSTKNRLVFISQYRELFPFNDALWTTVCQYLGVGFSVEYLVDDKSRVLDQRNPMYQTTDIIFHKPHFETVFEEREILLNVKQEYLDKAMCEVILVKVPRIVCIELFHCMKSHFDKGDWSQSIERAAIQFAASNACLNIPVNMDQCRTDTAHVFGMYVQQKMQNAYQLSKQLNDEIVRDQNFRHGPYITEDRDMDESISSDILIVTTARSSEPRRT